MTRFATLLAILITTFLWNAYARADSIREITRCTSDLLGGAAYIVRHIDPDDGTPFYRINKVAPRLEGSDLGFLDVKAQDVVRYGDALVVTVNRGRSGYAHLYSRGGTTLIDMNLFRAGDFNTDGPNVRYQCDSAAIR